MPLWLANSAGYGISISLTSSVSVIVLLKFFFFCIQEGYGTKIKGIIFVTGSKFIDGFVRLVKPFFSEKIASRIHVATSKNGVQEFIPEDILPEEYGGKEIPTEVLHGELNSLRNFELCCILNYGSMKII